MNELNDVYFLLNDESWLLTKRNRYLNKHRGRFLFCFLEKEYISSLKDFYNSAPWETDVNNSENVVIPIRFNIP